MIAESMSRQMIKRGLKGIKFSRIDLVLPEGLDGIGWYVHMPFCRRLCPYCSFRSIRYAADKVQPYIEGVKKEILTYRSRLGNIKTGDIYFGGGTPSLTWEGIIEIVEYIRTKFDIGGNVGFEASPEDINESMCDALMHAGVTRVSLGVQSFDDKVLRIMRRNYDVGHVLKVIELLLVKGFYVSIDLLYGLPHQQIASLLGDLQQASDTGVHQISYYPLMLFPFTRWFHDTQKGNGALPSTGMEKKMLYTISDFLNDNGYRQLSCWDFTRQSLHMNPYATCTRDENIGIGLSAYSKIRGLFYVNTFSLKEYINRVEVDLPVATATAMPPNRIMRRWFMMELFRLKVEKVEFERRFGIAMEKAMGRLIFMLKLFNIIREFPDCIQTTREGMYWVSLMTKTSMLTFPNRYYEECLHNPWPGEFQI